MAVSNRNLLFQGSIFRGKSPLAWQNQLETPENQEDIHHSSVIPSDPQPATSCCLGVKKGCLRSQGVKGFFVSCFGWWVEQVFFGGGKWLIMGVSTVGVLGPQLEKYLRRIGWFLPNIRKCWAFPGDSVGGLWQTRPKTGGYGCDFLLEPAWGPWFGKKNTDF